MKLEQFKNTKYLAAFCASLAVGSTTSYAAWLSPILPKLQSADSPLGYPVSSSDTSWMSSVNYLGATIMCVFAGMINKKIGPKKSLLYCSIILAGAWFPIMIATSAWVISVSRFFAGCMNGIVITALTIYNSEIADQNVRGRLCNMFTLVKLLAQLVVLTAGPFVSYTVLCIICAAFPISCCCSFYFMPDSPYYLVKMGNKEAARNSLLALSGGTDSEVSLKAKLKEIEEIVEKDMSNKTSVKEFIKNPLYRRSLYIMAAIKLFSLMSGGVALESYMQTIVGSSQSVISPEISSIVFGFIQFPAAFLTSYLIDKLGRKPLLFVSSFGCAVALLAEGVFFYVQDYQHGNVQYISWIPTAGIVLYFLMSPIGLLSLPYVLMGELFPLNIKESAVTLLTFYGGCMAFAVTKSFEPLREIWGLYTVFWIFAGFCIVSCIFTLTFMPETKGKSFGDIQKKLNRNRVAEEVQEPKTVEKY